MRPDDSPAVEVRVGPPNRTIAADDEIFVCAPDGTIGPELQQGYFCADTRVVSLLTLMLGGAKPKLLDSAVITPWSARFEYTNPALAWRGSDIAEHTIHLRVDCMIGRGMHEDLSVANHGQSQVDVRVALTVEGDYRDILEVKAGRTEPKARPATTCEGTRITTIYEVADFRRGLVVECHGGAATASVHDNELAFDLVLAPGDRWEGCVLWRPIVGDSEPPLPLHRCHDLLGARSEAGQRVREWRQRGTTRFRTGDATVDAVMAAAVADLAALRLYRPVHAALTARQQTHDGSWMPAAGIPWFVAPFGRDVLVASLQTLPLSPSIAQASLAVLTELQGADDDPLHDEQPGKIAHELRYGELAHFHRIPQTPYYGTHDAPSLFVLTAARFWDWTGDEAAIRRVAPAVSRCLHWIDQYGDLDGDGLQEYRPRSGQWGYYNQSWKDAADAIVHADGSLARHPIATCELQGYVVAAKRGWAEVVEAVFDRPREAERLRREAELLAELIEERFWWADEHIYYLGLDGAKEPIRSVASNAGHLLWAGAVTEDHAVLAARRLLADDLWSGWGVRTLSSRHPSFNPMSYQRGSVWPHDNAILVEGLLRYGLVAEASKVAQGILSAAASLQHQRLPELFAGFTRDEGAFPVQYVGANVPQAWASGAVVQLVAAFAGLHPRAGRELRVAAQLPTWLERLHVDGLRVGSGIVALGISRDGVDVHDVSAELRLHTT